MSRIDDPLSCFRCFDMKVIDPVAMNSIKGVLIEAYKEIEQLDDELYAERATGGEPRPALSILEKINRHIILLESLPNE